MWPLGASSLLLLSNHSHLPGNCGHGLVTLKMQVTGGEQGRPSPYRAGILGTTDKLTDVLNATVSFSVLKIKTKIFVNLFSPNN